MSQPTGTAKKKILIIDDEKHVVTYLETLLQDNGYDTLSAFDGKVAMEKVKSERPDLVCLDITMPVQSGIRFYRDLKENPQFTSIPVIVVTAATGPGGVPGRSEKFPRTRKQAPPPEGFYSKPIDRDKFLETVKKILS